MAEWSSIKETFPACRKQDVRGKILASSSPGHATFLYKGMGPFLTEEHSLRQPPATEWNGMSSYRFSTSPAICENEEAHSQVHWKKTSSKNVSRNTWNVLNTPKSSIKRVLNGPADQRKTMLKQTHTSNVPAENVLSTGPESLSGFIKLPQSGSSNDNLQSMKNQLSGN